MSEQLTAYPNRTLRHARQPACAQLNYWIVGMPASRLLTGFLLLVFLSFFPSSSSFLLICPTVDSLYLLLPDLP
jgi:hypothetical protein